MNAPDAGLKARVREHWEDETCGIRYGQATDRRAYFGEIAAARYALEPYLPRFADFASGRQKAILEIGVGAGSDFSHWCRRARHAVGVDLTDAAIALTTERLQLAEVPPERYTLMTSDAERLSVADEQFDLVYSWGVLHHTPDTAQAFREVLRTLKPGGEVRAMIYHRRSWTVLMLYAQHALARGRFDRAIDEVVSEHLESPGTKAYSLAETRAMLAAIGFTDIRLTTKLGPGDLLTIAPSKRYQSRFFRLIWRIYPRPLVRLIGDRYGLNLLITAKKPLGAR